MKRQGFHSSDFIGTQGAGLSRLRAARAANPAAFEPEKATRIETRDHAAEIRELLRAGKAGKAIIAAAKLPDLGDEAAAIHRGREAILRPSFQRQLGRDPAELIEEAAQAVARRFS